VSKMSEFDAALNDLANVIPWKGKDDPFLVVDRARAYILELEEKRRWWNRMRLAKERFWCCCSEGVCKGDRFTARKPDKFGRTYCSECKP